MVTHHYVIINFTYKKSSKHQLVEVQKLYDFLNTHDPVIAFLSMSSFYTCCESLHSILNMPNSVIDLGQTPIYLSGTWLSVTPRTNTKKTC